ncbi:MAG: hypothetical protein CMM02_17600 [Rhodopirellula sp.]|nr:hypothetical protein [Rhodopirellula sp.]
MDRTKLSVFLLVPLLALAALVAPLWIQGELPVFRDAGHYYYPSFHFEHELWNHGTVPLWSHLDDLGRPFAADSSTSIFYPVKLLFWLPLSFPNCVLLYLITHLILAGLNTYYLARRWRATASGAALASLSFCVGGAVLTQHSNIIYLVSAAWLPLAVSLSLDLIEKQDAKKSLACLAVTLALMILGGDPQMALHVMLLIPLLYLFAGKTSNHNRQPKKIPKRKVARRMVITGIIAFGLAAIQILPTYTLTKNANRNLRSASRTTFEWIADQVTGNEVPNNIFKGRRSSEHHGQLYQFSLAPWQITELAFPNITGKLYPQRQRWTFLLEDNPRTWYPSIYQGILPLLFALSIFGLGKNAQHKQLSRMILFTILASLGAFGIGWLITTLSGAKPVASETGGVYWFLCNVVPGYIQFRYPAKWFILASLLIAILAGVGFDTVNKDTERRRTIFNWSMVGLCAALLTCYPLLSQLLTKSLVNSPPDSFLGPAASQGVKRDLLQAAIQPLVIVLAFIVTTKLVRQEKAKTTIVLILLAADLLFANSWLFSSASSYHWDAISPIEQLVKDSTKQVPTRIYRTRLSNWNPPSFAKQSSAQRQREAILWDRRSLRPRMHLLSDIQLLDANASISDVHYDSVLRVLRKHGRTREDNVSEPDVDGLALLGASHIIGPENFHPRQDETLTRPTSIEDVAITTTANPAPFFWTVPNWKVRTPFSGATPAQLDQITKEVFYPEGFIADLQNLSTLESNSIKSSTSPISVKQDVIRLESFEPGFVRLRVLKEEDGPLIINQGFDSGWHARIWNSENTLPQPTPLIRANRVMQAVLLKKGEQTIDLIYRPTSFLFGLAISGICWLMLCSSLVVSGFQARRALTR